MVTGERFEAVVCNALLFAARARKYGRGDHLQGKSQKTRRTCNFNAQKAPIGLPLANASERSRPAKFSGLQQTGRLPARIVVEPETYART
jgi:hypothetical protein